jgi:hypothetical protein
VIDERPMAGTAATRTMAIPSSSAWNGRLILYPPVVKVSPTSL